MKDRRTDSQQGPAQEQHRVIRGVGQREQTTHGDGHAEGERIRLRFPIGVHTDQRLQQRSRDLKDERERPDLSKRQIEVAFKDRIGGNKQRLHRVVQHVTDARRAQHTIRHGDSLWTL